MPKYVVLLFCLTHSFLFSQKEIYIPAEWQAGGFDYSLTRSAQSANFIVFWGPLAGNDPTQAPSDIAFDPQNILNTSEDLYKFYIDTIRFINDDSGLISQYKIILVMLNTWPGLEGWAFGGNYDSTVGAMWMHPQAASSGPTLAHEFTHTLQNYTWMMNPGHGFIDSSYVGFFWETHAEFMAMQKYPSFALEFDMARWLNTCQFHWSSTRHHYQAFIFLQFIKEKDGIAMINRLWNESNIGEHPLETYKRLKGIDQEALNDLFAEYAMKNVTWDYEIGNLLRERIATLNPVFTSHPTIIPELVDTARQWYGIQNHLAPQDYGYNIIRLYPQQLEGCEKRIVYLNFNAQFIFPDYLPHDYEKAPLRYGFVAVDQTGHPRYSEIYKTDQELGFELNDNENEFYLVVIGAPKVHHNYKWEIGFPKIYRYPYSVKFKNAFPEGFQPGFHAAPDSIAGNPHPLGGGFVASTASVEPSVYIGKDAQVLDQVTITGNVRIEDYATIRDNAFIEGNAVISGLAIIGENAHVFGNAVVKDQAHVFGGCEVYDSAIVEDNALIFFTKVYENAALTGNTFCWEANLHGDVFLGGDAEFFGECSDGTYMQVDFAYNRNCDGLDDHPANQDVTKHFISSIGHDQYSLTCDGLRENVFEYQDWFMCDGDTFYFYGIPLTMSGEYEKVFQAENGADSVVILWLDVNVDPEAFIIAKVCPGDSLVLYGHIFTQPGSYEFFTDTILPCGALVHLYLGEIDINTTVIQVGNTLWTQNTNAIYQWYDCSTGLPIPGAIYSIYTPDIDGYYQCRFTTQEGCVAFSECQFVSTVAIDDPQLRLEWEIFPNPSRDFLQIRLEHIYDDDIKIEILDVSGRIQVRQSFLSENNIEKIDISGLSPATYLIKLSDKQGHFSLKYFSKI